MAKNSKSIIVTVSDDALAKIERVASELGARGMEVERVLPVTGVITGSCTASKIPALGEIDGVTSVEEEASAELPPPDSSVQ